jgi:enterochelin esterase family protein
MLKSKVKKTAGLTSLLIVVAALGFLTMHLDMGASAAAPTPSPTNGPSPTTGPVPTSCNGPTVNADRTVTFCLTAPQASDVQLNFQNMLGLSPAADAFPMAKTDNGIWYITMGSLEPNWYGYGFIVGGARIADPQNRNIWSLDRSAWSNVMVPGPGTEFMAETDVPHGAVATVYYHSNVTQTERRMEVYTPPGYNRDRRAYPVFYLLHGGGGNDTDWIANMRANFILDNLIAQRKIAPMVVVMPDMNAGATEQSCQRTLECPAPQELMGSVIPYTEQNYRVLHGAQNRALAGLSVGGDVVRNALLHYPNAFAYAGFFSGGQMPPEVITDLTQNHPDLITGLANSKELKLLWMSFGGEEALVSNHQHWLAATEAVFDQYGVKYTYVDGPTFGAIYGHVWDTWRKDLFVFAPRLFRRAGPAPH